MSETFDLIVQRYLASRVLGCARVHLANSISASQALSRLASCVLQSGIELPYKAINHLLIHIERHHGSRRVQEILKLESYSPIEDWYQLKTVFGGKQQLITEYN